MKRSIALIAVVVMCLSFLSGCGMFGKAEHEIMGTVSEIVEQVNAPREFIHIPTERGEKIYTAEMYDEDTVIMMTEGDEDNTFKIAKYDIGTNDLSYVCSGELDRGADEANDFYSFITLSANPLVIRESIHDVIYKFSDDFTSVQTLETSELGAYLFAYSKTRNSIVYAYSTDYACELREYSLSGSKMHTLVDLGDKFSYIWLEQLLDDSGVAVLSGGKLFSEEYVYLMIDMQSMSIIGETEDQYTYFTTDSGVELISHDYDTDSLLSGTVKYGDGTLRSALYDMTEAGEEKTDISAVSISTDGSLLNITEDDRMFDFTSNGGSACRITAYDLYDSTILCESDFDYAAFSNIELDFSSDEYDGDSRSVYLMGSACNSYENGHLVFGLVSSEYMNAVFVWNTDSAEEMNTPISSKTTMEFGLTPLNESEFYDSNTEYAETIENKYGVRIFYGDSADIDFIDYTVEMVYDERDIYKGLRELEKALKLFPDGFFEEFSNSEYLRGVNFYLCGNMTPYNDESISEPAAFTYTSSGYALVVVNVLNAGNLVSNYCHEISHVIDTRLLAVDMLDETVWESFNPGDFSYNYGYMGENGDEFETDASDKYTAWDDDYYRTWDPDYVYFVDSYSMTFPTEDRARLFENAILVDEYFPDYFNSVHIQAKLEYYFKCIRDCWDTSGWSEKTAWEAALKG